MKIMICGSMTFSKEMAAAKKSLEAMSHEARLPCDIDVHLKDSGLIDDLDADLEHCLTNNVLRTCMDYIAWSDAVLVMNYPKNGIKGYVGASVLMEMGLAFYMGKRIFLLFPVPHPSEARWSHEVRLTSPVVIDGDLSKIR
jgi:hypothetical protein